MARIRDRAVEAAARAAHDADAQRCGESAECWKWGGPLHRGVWVDKARPFVDAAVPIVLGEIEKRIEANYEQCRTNREPCLCPGTDAAVDAVRRFRAEWGQEAQR